nr:hypothetical protein [Tanacetum cinerariifolium]
MARQTNTSLDWIHETCYELCSTVEGVRVYNLLGCLMSKFWTGELGVFEFSPTNSLWMVRHTHIQPITHSKLDINLGSWSQIIETGIPCLVTTSSKYNLANSSIGSFSLIGKKCADLGSRSTTTHMVLFPLCVLKSLVTKSMGASRAFLMLASMLSPSRLICSGGGSDGEGGLDLLQDEGGNSYESSGYR